MRDIGERLEHAIKQRMGSVRKFERTLKKQFPDVRGTSRQTLYRYFAGESDPGPAVIHAAAETLGVREDWLATGDGEMDAEAERLRRAQEAAVMGDDEEVDPIRGLLEAVAEAEGPDLLGRITPAAVFFDLVLRSTVNGECDLGDSGVFLGRLVMHPLHALGTTPDQSSQEFADYVVAACHALSLAMRVPNIPTKEKNDG